MGIIYDTLCDMDKENQITMEAEDVTNDTRREAAQMNGEQDDSSGDISLNTDNIFGDASGKDTNSDEPNDVENEESEEDDLPDEDALDGLDDEVSEKESDSIQKKQLRKQMTHLYKVIGDDIDLMSEYIPKVTTPETNEVLATIKKNLGQCKECIHDILTEEFAKSEYPTLMKKFVSLRQVYDLTAKAIEIHFNNQNKKDTY